MSHILSAVAWPYANGPRHIGHVAGFGVPSDVFSRYMRMAGHDVLMVSGTDEHGTPILVQAEKEGVAPQVLADRYNRVIVEDLAQLGLTYDLFTRTTTRNHYAVAQELFRQVHANGYMIEQTTVGAISPSTGRTLPDRYIEGICPICSYPHARGDQCDNCGNQLDAAELKEPRSRINGETPIFTETEHFFLDLPALADAIAAWLETRSNWRPNVLNFSRNLLEDVRPRAMTRDIDWGIPVPLAGWEENPGKRLYVWFDAVVGYLSASVEWARREDLKTGGDGSMNAETAQRWREWWNDPMALSYYFMGKDNITFHSQIWPGAAPRLQRRGQPRRRARPARPPQPAHRGGEQRVPQRGGRAVLHQPRRRHLRPRHALPLPARRAALLHRRRRSGVLRRRLHVGGVPAPDQRRTRRRLGQPRQPHRHPRPQELRRDPHARGALDRGPRAAPATQAGFTRVGDLVRVQRQRAAIGEAMRVVSEVNRYVSQQQPWTLKTDRERLGTVLHTMSQAVADCSRLLAPFLPHSSDRVHDLFGVPGPLAPQPVIEEVTDLDDATRAYPVITGDYRLGETVGAWDRVDVVPGTPMDKPSPIFTKLTDEAIADEIERLKG